MPDPIERKRLKKKMLDRWENEGGRICTDPAGADAAKPTRERKGKSKQLTSRGNAKASGPASSSKRKPNRE